MKTHTVEMLIDKIIVDEEILHIKFFDGHIWDEPVPLKKSKKDKRKR